jgi:phenylacetate-CoA ligase
MYKSNKYLHSLYSLSPQFVKNGLAGFYSFLVAKKKYGQAFLQWSALLKKSQYYNSVELEKLQVRLLNDFIKSAVNNSKYYRNIALNCGLDLDRLLDLKSIKKFPVINKKVVRENYDDILNKQSAKYKFSSSGTTGASLHVYLDEEAYQREYAFRWHYFEMAGAKRKDKFAYFLGNNLHPSEKQKPPFHIIDPYEHSIFFSLFHMSDENLKYYLKAFNHFRPSFVKGYPSGLYIFAKFIKDHGLKVHKPKALFSASEVLHDFQKSILEEVFQCPVYQWYGQVETTINIHECEHRQLHVKEEYGLLELLNDDGNDAKPGEIANVIATGWGNKAFPLIRYNTGDNMILALDQNCPCGRNGRIIEKIIGRDEDFIITPEGRKIGRLDFVFKPVDTVDESQIIQESLNQILVKVVPMPGYSEHDEQLIKKMIIEYIGTSMNIRIEKVKSIERSANGKIRYVISKVIQS